MSKRQVWINASDVSVFVGKNKFDIVPPFERLLSRCTSDFVKTPTAQENTSRALGDSVVKSCNLDTDVIQVIKEYTKENPMPSVERIQLERDLRSVINTTHGIANEQQAVAEYHCNSGTLDTPIDTSQQLMSKSVLTPQSHFEFVICGRVDGIQGDTVLEIKNRTRGLMNCLKEYEKVQVYMYMYLTGLTKCKLVEKYQDQSSIQIVSFDPIYNTRLFKRLVSFLNRLQEFALNADLLSKYNKMNRISRKKAIEDIISCSSHCQD